jgi:hypothetical protein
METNKGIGGHKRWDRRVGRKRQDAKRRERQ